MSEFNNKLNIICLESQAFYELIEEVVYRMKEQQNIQHDKWISDKEAMNILRISSKTTLQKLRDKGNIRFSQPNRKLILYDRNSILEYLETNAKDTF